MSRSRRIVIEDNEVLDDSQMESTDAAMLEMNEVTSELEKVQEDIDEASDTMDTMDSTADGLDNVIEEGGLTEGVADVINTSIEHMRRRMGFSKRTKFMPSMESFNAKSTRIQATRIVQEGLIEMAKKLWKSIVSLFDRAIQWVKDFWKKNFTAVGRIKERINNMLMKLEGMKDGDKAKGKKVDYESAADVLYTGKKLIEDPGTAIKKLHKAGIKSIVFICDILGTIDKVFDTGIEVTGKRTLLKVDEIKSAKDNKKEHIDATMKTSDDFVNVLSNFKPSFTPLQPPKDYDIPDGCRLYGVETDIADTGVYVILPDNGIQGWDYLALFARSKGFLETKANGEDEPPGNTTAPVWGVGDIYNNLKELLNMFENLDNEDVAKVMKFIDSGLAKAEKLANKNPKDNEEDKAMRKLAPLARVMLQMGTTFMVQLMALLTKTAHAVCDVSQRCMHMHSGKDD